MQGRPPHPENGTRRLSHSTIQAKPRVETARLSEQQRTDFDRDGFLVVPGALPPATVAALTEAVDALYAAGLERDGLSATHHWELRNCLPHHPAFLELVDWPATFPLVVDLLGWNIHLITSHLIMRAPSPPDAGADWKASGWHRDGGTSATEMAEPHPRLLIKIAYWLSDLTEPGRGAIRLLPGSNRMVGPPAWAPGAADPYGALEITARPGDAVLFEQRTWHAVGPNHSNLVRKSLFFGYGYRWLRPMDYVTMPCALLDQATPIRRQLLGDATTQLGYYLPTDDDVPLRAWWRARAATAGQTNADP